VAERAAKSAQAHTAALVARIAATVRLLWAKGIAGL
jgi:hypothetical protein